MTIGHKWTRTGPPRALQAERAKLQVRHTQGTWLDEGKL